jgi:hypothetical protein
MKLLFLEDVELEIVEDFDEDADEDRFDIRTPNFE